MPAATARAVHTSAATASSTIAIDCALMRRLERHHRPRPIRAAVMPRHFGALERVVVFGHSLLHHHDVPARFDIPRGVFGVGR